MTARGYAPIGSCHAVLRQAGVVIEKPTQVEVITSSLGGRVEERPKMQGWAPIWAKKIAAWHDSKYALLSNVVKPAYVRVQLIKIAAADEHSRHLILEDPVAAWKMIEGVK